MTKFFFLEKEQTRFEAKCNPLGDWPIAEESIGTKDVMSDAHTRVADNEMLKVTVTCLYGITNGTLKISESVQEFMSRVRIKANFAQFTRPNGSPVWINGSSVSAVRVPLQDEYVTAVNALVFTSALTQGVKETPSNATTAVNAHGGDL